MHSRIIEWQRWLFVLRHERVGGPISNNQDAGEPVLSTVTQNLNGLTEPAKI